LTIAGGVDTLEILEAVMEKQAYECVKCGNTRYESDQFQATGGNIAKILDIQNKKFITVTCTNCGYTELYRAKTGLGWNILDLFTN
jgi:predicted nucleic-acid-binding Zn-ribbon protein